MRTLVIYNSQTGFTKKYAEWISEGLNAELSSLKEAKKKDLSLYDAIVFGSWCMAGGLAKLDWFKDKLVMLRDKKTAIFACGASPSGNPDVNNLLTTKFTDSAFEKTKVFYCPGGLNYGRMKPASRIMMKLFAKMLQNKKDKTPEEASAAEMVGKDYDITDKKYALEVIDWIKG